MDPLLSDLKARGVLDDAAVEWVGVHQTRTGETLDFALLDLDLVDEETLLSALEIQYGLPAATPDDLVNVDPEAAIGVSAATSRALRICPVAIEGGELIAFVTSALAPAALEQIRQSVGLPIRQLVVPTHYLEQAWDFAYGIPVDERTHDLEIRLERRRSSLGVREVLERVASTAQLSAAVAAVLEFSASLVELAGFLVNRHGRLRVAQMRGALHGPGTPVPLAETGCTFGAAIQHGGYFFGPLAGTEADHAFYRALQRPLPRRAFVAPVPASGGTVVFYADNGPRGIVTRWAAELTVLVSRVHQEPDEWEARWRGDEWVEESDDETLPEQAESTPAQAQARQQAQSHPVPSEPEPETTAPELTAPDDSDPVPEPLPEPDVAPAPVAQQGPEEPQPPVPAPAPDPQPALSAAEQWALHRLTQAAAAEGVPIDAFVDTLLRDRAAATAPKSSEAIEDAVKELFEKLATDIPTQMARGMETAFRDLVPRLGGGSTGAPPAGHAAAAPEPAAPRPKIALVRTEAAPKERESYRSRRRKSKRHKL